MSNDYKESPSLANDITIILHKPLKYKKNSFTQLSYNLAWSQCTSLSFEFYVFLIHLQGDIAIDVHNWVELCIQLGICFLFSFAFHFSFLQIAEKIKEEDLNNWHYCQDAAYWYYNTSC